MLSGDPRCTTIPRSSGVESGSSSDGTSAWGRLATGSRLVSGMTGAREETQSDLEIAERVREACLRAALDGYERAAISGLCAEGAWEAAIGAMRMIDLQTLLDTPRVRSDPPETEGLSAT